MVDGADERKQAPEAIESASPKPGDSSASVTTAENSAAPEVRLSEVAQSGARDRVDELRPLRADSYGVSERSC